VPAHADATENIAPLARLNAEKVLAIGETILSLCEEPRNFERILQDVFAVYSLSMSMEQYVLVGSTVRSFLSWLSDQGKVIGTFAENMLLWERA
jgi:hypothetical protein